MDINYSPFDKIRTPTTKSSHSSGNISPRELHELGLKGLQVGGGKRLFRACINTDIEPPIAKGVNVSQTSSLRRLESGEYYLQQDATTKFPFEDESFHWIFSEHFIEHISIAQSIAWMSEMYRLLVPGGAIRISTPDLARYVEGYLDPTNNFYDSHWRQLLFETQTRIPLRKAAMMNQIFFHWGHQWIYDLAEIQYVGMRAGFQKEAIHEVEFRKGRNAELANLDYEPRRDESLYVELYR